MIRRTCRTHLVATAAVALAVLSSPEAARAGETPARAMTDLDDAMACLPLDGGGLAVATGGGLAIVSADGHVRTLTALDGLPDTRVHALASTRDGLWLGTESGAALVEPVALSVVRTVPLGHVPVHAVLPTASGVYLGTWGAGLALVRGRDGEPEWMRALGTGSHVAAIAEHGGAVFVAYADGPVGKLEGTSVRALPTSPSHGQALATINVAGGAELVLGDIEGLFRIDGASTPVASVDARGVAARGSRLLVASFGQGLLEGSAGGALHAVRGVPRFVRGVAVRGEIGCAATPDGVYVSRGGGDWKKVPLGGPPSNDVTALAASGTSMAIGTFDHGAVLATSDGLSRVSGLEPNETVNSLVWQGEGRAAVLWLGTAHGVVRVDRDGGVRRIRAADGLPSSVVRIVLPLADGSVLVGTDDGAAFVAGSRVTLLAPKAKGATPLASPMHATWALAAGADGTIWVGTMAGLYAVKDGVARRLSVASGDLHDDWVTALVVQGSDVWVGTYAGGVTRLRPGSPALHLGGGCINPAGLTFVGTDLYAATMEGLLRRGTQDDRAPWYPLASAAPGRDVTAARVVGGALWVASRRGVGVTPM